jgi:hypothetical protein
MIEAVKMAKESGCELAILSDANTEFIRAILQVGFGLGFLSFILSSESRVLMFCMGSIMV